MQAEQLLLEYEKVRSFAADMGLQWLLDELDSAIEEGVTETKRLRSVRRDGRDEFEELPPTAPGRRRAEEFLVRRSVTLEEQVGALVEALRRALVDVELISQSSVEQLQPLLYANRSVVGTEDEQSSRRLEDATQPITEIDYVPDEGSRDADVSTEGLRYRTGNGATDLMRDVLQRLARQMLS